MLSPAGGQAENEADVGTVDSSVPLSVRRTPLLKAHLILLCLFCSSITLFRSPVIALTGCLIMYHLLLFSHVSKCNYH